MSLQQVWDSIGAFGFNYIKVGSFGSRFPIDVSIPSGLRVCPSEHYPAPAVQNRTLKFCYRSVSNPKLIIESVAVRSEYFRAAIFDSAIDTSTESDADCSPLVT